MSIPKQILQIALGEDYLKRLPLELIKTNILSLNPRYTYTLFTDSECIAFLTSNFPEHLELYNSLSRPQYKSDLIRYLYIYMNGGYYIDIDLLPTTGFDELNKLMDFPSTFFTLGAHKRDNKHIECANGFFGSEEKNPLLMEFVKEMYTDINPGDYGMNVKRMYSILENKMIIKAFDKVNDIFFLEEYCKGQSNYFIRSCIDRDICYSNGNGYPHNLLRLNI
jgi:mannosyltransferase OCH1-like enzyme